MSRSLKETLLGAREVPTNIPAVRYGLENKKPALEKLVETLSREHENLRSLSTGCFISSKYPCLGATPDAR